MLGPCWKLLFKRNMNLRICIVQYHNDSFHFDKHNLFIIEFGLNKSESRVCIITYVYVFFL